MRDFKETTNADSFIRVEKWMVFDLELSGIDLLLYGLIYGYTLSCGGFTGSRSYLVCWLGCSLNTLDAHINALVAREYFKKTSWLHNGERRVCITAVEETYMKAKAAAAARRASPAYRSPTAGTTPDSGQGVLNDCGTPAQSLSTPAQSLSTPTSMIEYNTDKYNTNYTDSGNARTRANRAGKKKGSGERGTKQTTASSFETDDFFLAALRRSFGDDATY